MAAGRGEEMEATTPERDRGEMSASMGTRGAQGTHQCDRRGLRMAELGWPRRPGAARWVHHGGGIRVRESSNRGLGENERGEGIYPDKGIGLGLTGARATMVVATFGQKWGRRRHVVLPCRNPGIG